MDKLLENVNADTHQEQESEDVLPGSIIAVVARGVNGLCPYQKDRFIAPFWMPKLR